MCSCYVLFMPGADVLSSYPYVVVRIACRRCTRKGSYRLSSRTSNRRQASPRIANPTARSAPTGAFGADAHIGNMAREDFLGCLSKAWIEKVGSSLRVLPRPRAKDTRAEVIKQAFSEVARHAPFSTRMRRVMGHADRSSRSMLVKAQADRFAVDLILDCEPRPAAKIRVTVTGRAGTRPWRRYLYAAAHAPSLVDLERIFAR